MWLFGPNIDKLAKNHDLSGLLKAWPDADAGGRDKIRSVLNQWLNNLQMVESSTLALMSLGLVEHLKHRIEEYEFDGHDSRVRDVLAPMIEASMAASDVATVKWLLINVRGWIGDMSQYRFHQRTLGAVIPFLRDHGQVPDLIDIVLHAADHPAGAAAERALLQRGGPEAVGFYNDLAQRGFFGVAGVTIVEYVDARRKQILIAADAYESDWLRIKSQRVRDLAHEDQDRRKEAVDLAKRLAAGPFPPDKAYGLVHEPRFAGGVKGVYRF